MINLPALERLFASHLIDYLVSISSLLLCKEFYLLCFTFVLEDDSPKYVVGSSVVFIHRGRRKAVERFFFMLLRMMKIVDFR